jgi:hypothetical protein
VVVSPGVMVVPDYDREVFFVNGYYWCHSDGVWFRTRSHRGGWAKVSHRRVPRSIYRSPRGKYKHFRGGRPYYRSRGHRGHSRVRYASDRRYRGDGRVVRGGRGDGRVVRGGRGDGRVRVRDHRRGGRDGGDRRRGGGDRRRRR